MDDDKYETCERCGRDSPPEHMESITLLEERSLCEGCVFALDYRVEQYDWRDRYTEEQHKRALSIVRERDEIECSIESYEDGQIIIHTRYVTSDVITDLCNHFGFKVVAFGPQWKQQEAWPCMKRHGSIFEIVLQYDHTCPKPVPMSVQFDDAHIEQVDENDKQF